MRGKILLEKLAQLEYEQWAGWAAEILAEEPGLSPERRQRWTRLLARGYHNLPPRMKAEDRALARRVLALLHEYLKEGPR